MFASVHSTEKCLLCLKMRGSVWQTALVCCAMKVLMQFMNQSFIDHLEFACASAHPILSDPCACLLAAHMAVCTLFEAGLRH